MKHLSRTMLSLASILAAGCYVQPGYVQPRVAPVVQQVGDEPPPVAYEGQPETVVLPGTNVYVVPDLATDLFFASGYWWRPYGAGWYRSAYYDRGWVPYGGVPAFYRGVPRNWRYNYAHHTWNGRPWNYQRVHVQGDVHTGGQRVHAHQQPGNQGGQGGQGGPGGPNGRHDGARFESQPPAMPGHPQPARVQGAQHQNAQPHPNQSHPNKKGHNN